MHIRFTKMHGAGNDFVVLDETRGQLGLAPAHYRLLADRHRGIGCDQILSVRAASTDDVDFDYAIHNADGGEVEQCGNGARCFAAFVRAQGLSASDTIRVRTRSGVIAPRIDADGTVTVDMGRPAFEPRQVPFDAAGLTPHGDADAMHKWPLALGTQAQNAIVYVATLSMGNPHAVQVVDDVETAPVATVGPLIECHPRFPERVNAGFMQVMGRDRIRLRVYERGAGETLACGTGACAAVVAGIRLGLLDAQVAVETRGGNLDVTWRGGDHAVFMRGPAITVFSGEIDLPDTP